MCEGLYFVVEAQIVLTTTTSSHDRMNSMSNCGHVFAWYYLLKQLGPNGDVKIERASDGKLFIRAQELHITNALFAKKIYIDGVSLEEYFENRFEKYVDARIAKALKK